MNRSVLKIAWLNICVIANALLLRQEIIIIIILIWLIVEKAMTFFRSFSKFAARLAIIRVVHEINLINGKMFFVVKLNFKNRYTPAVTRVEECTIAEIGVGADIAAGSHDERGTWALLVEAAKKIVLIKL